MAKFNRSKITWQKGFSRMPTNSKQQYTEWCMRPIKRTAYGLVIGADKPFWRQKLHLADPRFTQVTLTPNSAERSQTAVELNNAVNEGSIRNLYRSTCGYLARIGSRHPQLLHTKYCTPYLCSSKNWSAMSVH